MEKNRIIIVAVIVSLVLIELLFAGFLYLSSPQVTSSKLSSPFTVIVLPDIQNYSSSENAEVLFSQLNWIIQNKEKLNIKFVQFEGDLVNNWNNTNQWSDVNKVVSILEEANVPFELVLGNHDHNGADARKNAPYFEEYFPLERFSGMSWWGGSFGSYNTYQIINSANKDFLFLGLDACPSKEEVAWAEGVFSQNKEKQLILTTHGYLGSNDTLNVHACGSTKYIWEMAKKHSNLQIILSGHEHGEALLVSTNDFGKEVYQMLADYQDYPKGGNGYLRILNFIPAENKLVVSTYSPYLDEYETDSNSSLVLGYTLN